MTSLLPPDMDAQIEARVDGLPLAESLVHYLRHGVPVGSFLLAVLSNDLYEAVRRGDDENQRALADYVRVLTWAAPHAAWGSPERVRAWMQLGAEQRMAAMEIR